MDTKKVVSVFEYISSIMTENRDYLIKLDQQNGDGDLGISMSSGYKAVCEYLKENTETDLGVLFMKVSTVFNENAPSSLGTITSFGLMGMAKFLKGKEQASQEDIILALDNGLENIMKKAGSKPGEKTIIDSLHPAIEVLKLHKNDNNAFELACRAAKEGSENTLNMKSVHGRAAYYAEKSLGIIDGGSVVGALIFQAIFDYTQNK